MSMSYLLVWGWTQWQTSCKGKLYILPKVLEVVASDIRELLKLFADATA